MAVATLEREVSISDKTEPARQILRPSRLIDAIIQEAEALKKAQRKSPENHDDRYADAPGEWQNWGGYSEWSDSWSDKD